MTDHFTEHTIKHLQSKLGEANKQLNHNKCHSGHETLPLKLWDCPECHNETKRELEKTRARLVYGFYEDNHPHYSQGDEKLTQLHELVTAHELNNLVGFIKRLEANKNTLLSVLKFYADENNWIYTIEPIELDIPYFLRRRKDPVAILDQGDMARQILKKIT